MRQHRTQGEYGKYSLCLTVKQTLEKHVSGEKKMRKNFLVSRQTSVAEFISDHHKMIIFTQKIDLEN